MVLLLVSIVLVLALFAINISDKTGMPSLLLFLGLGLLANFVGLDFDNYWFADKFATFGLIIIMFYGGFGTNWSMGKPVVKEAVTLASLGVVATGILTGLFVHYVFKFDMLESMLLGSIVASTDYSSVSNILTSKNLNLKYNTAPLLELESGSNDPTAYTMTMLFLSVIAGTKISIPIMILKQIGFGLIVGFIMAYLIGKVLKRLNLNKDGLSIVFMFAMALFTFSFTNVIGGNGYLAVYIFGIIIGNQSFYGKRDVVFFFDGFSELMNIGLFFILGLLANPESVLKTLPIAAAIMAFMTIVARPATVFGLTIPFRLKFNQLIVISWAGLRGAAAIAFAIMVVNSGLEFSVDIYSVVFGICFLSSFIQGSGMAPISKGTDMLDPNDTVLRNFNYYQDKGDIGFLKTTIQEGSYLIGIKVNQISLVFDFIVAKIKRGDKTIVPRGDVELQAGDVVVLAGEEYFDYFGDELIEFTVTDHHEWKDKKIMDLNLPNSRLILTVQRENGEFILPEGKTVIQKGDLIIMLQDEKMKFG